MALRQGRPFFLPSRITQVAHLRSRWLWLDTEHPVLGCTACQLDRRVYGIEIEFARTRRRPTAADQLLKMVTAKPTLIASCPSAA
jgi:hypothetical protein